MNPRRHSGPVYSDTWGIAADDMNHYGVNEFEAPVRYERGRRRRSITVTRKETMPATGPQSPAPLPQRARPVKRGDSSISRASDASAFATIGEGAVRDDVRGDVRQSCSSPSTDAPSGNEPHRRRVSIVGLQRSRSTSLVDFTPMRLSTVSDAVVSREAPRPRRRNSVDESTERNQAMTGQRSGPARSTPRRYHRVTGPAYQSHPSPLDMGQRSRDVLEGSLADSDDRSYGTAPRRASLASIHEMHRVVTVLKNQKGQKRHSQDDSGVGYGSRRSSRGSSLRQPEGSASCLPKDSAASLSAQRRLSISASIQDMHRRVSLIKEKQQAKRLNCRVQFSAVEDGAARPPGSRRGSSAGGRRGSNSAVSVSRMTGRPSRRSSHDSDSHSSNGDHSLSSGTSSDETGSSSAYADTDDSSPTDDTSSVYSDASSDSVTSSGSGSQASECGPSTQAEHEDDDRSAASSSATEADSGNGMLGSSRWSKIGGRPTGTQDLPGPSGLGRAARVSPERPLTRESYSDFSSVTNGQPSGEREGQATSKACVIL